MACVRKVVFIQFLLGAISRFMALQNPAVAAAMTGRSAQQMRKWSGQLSVLQVSDSDDARAAHEAARI
jgi:hypothetical protein